MHLSFKNEFSFVCFWSFKVNNCFKIYKKQDQCRLNLVSSSSCWALIRLTESSPTCIPEFTGGILIWAPKFLCRAHVACKTLSKPRILLFELWYLLFFFICLKLICWDPYNSLYISLWRWTNWLVKVRRRGNYLGVLISWWTVVECQWEAE